MDIKEIKVGDTVRLKGGGPIMTVDAVRDNALAECLWFENGKDGGWGAMRGGSIRAALLEHAAVEGETRTRGAGTR